MLIFRNTVFSKIVTYCSVRNPWLSLKRTGDIDKNEQSSNWDNLRQEWNGGFGGHVLYVSLSSEVRPIRKHVNGKMPFIAV